MRLTFAVLLAIAAAAIPLSGQITVTIKPVRAVTLKKSLHLGRAAQVNTFTACSDSAVKLTLERGRIETAFPEITMLSTAQAEDVLGRQTRDSVASIAGETGDTWLGLLSDGAGVAGFATGSREAQLAALGVTGLRFIFRMAASRAPDPRPTLASLLPDVLILQPGGCSAPGITVVSPLVAGAKPLQRLIVVRPL